MRQTRGAVLLAAMIASAASCGESGRQGATSAQLAAMCQPRPDSTTPGCFADPGGGMLCAPTGCQSLCSGGDVPVTCLGPSPTGPIPEPDDRAGCAIITIPTPSNALFYCCPCGAR